MKIDDVIIEGLVEAEKTAKVFHPQYVDVYFLDGPRKTPLLVNRKVPYNLIDRYLEVAIKKYNLQKSRFEFRNAEEDPVAEGEGNLKEFSPSGAGPSGGNYFQALASAWYNGAFDTGSLQKGIKSKEDVERLLQRGIVCPDGVTRKFGIDYNAKNNGVVISSDDYYEHSDHGKRPGTMIDVHTRQPWGPYDYMEFSDADLSDDVDEGIRVANQQIPGTKNRAKSAYYPTNVKPKVPKLAKPLTDQELARLAQLAGIKEK